MATKIGWHIIDNDADPTDLTRLAHCAAIKFVGGENVYKRAAEASGRYPGKPIVIRLIHKEDGGRPPTPADAMAYIHAYATAHGLTHCWFQTLRNMPEMDAVTAAWDAELLRLARPLGIKLIIGDFSMGKSGVAGVWPGEDRWPRYYPALQEAHSSGPGLVKLGYQLYIGNGDLTYGEGWRSLPLRYQDVDRVHFRPRGWVIEWCGTEAGFDAGNMAQEGVSPEAAAATMIVLDRDHWAPDPRLAWAFEYTLDKSSWAQNGFNMRGTLFDRVTQYQMAGPVPTPVPTPPPSGARFAKVLGQLNQRATPSATAALLGELNAGAYIRVALPPTNGYVEVTNQGNWVYTASGRLMLL